MPAMTNLLVKDDAATPVETTLIPLTDAGGVPKWRADAANVAIDGQLRFSLMEDVTKSGDYRLSAKLEVPIMETLGTAGTSYGYVAPQAVAFVIPYIFTAFYPKRSTKAQRADGFKMMMGLLQGASATTATGILSNTAAGDAWKNNANPVPAFFTQMLKPF